MGVAKLALLYNASGRESRDADAVTATVVLEGHVQQLVDVSDLVPDVVERLEPLLLGRARTLWPGDLLCSVSRAMSQGVTSLSGR